MEEKKDPLVAIWMLTYNHVNYIKQAVEGVMMQQANFDYILYLSEDFSTDGTRELCVKLKEKYPNKIDLFLPKENLGIKGENSIGIKTYQRCFDSGAKYIALCEGDDYWTDPLKLQKQVDFLETHPEYAGSFHKTDVLKEGKMQPRVFGQEAPDVMNAEDTLTTLSPFHTSSFVFKNCIDNLPVWYQNVVSGDMALFSIVASHGLLKKISEVMSVYRKHEKGITNTAYVQNTYHQKRIELINYLNEFHKFVYKEKAEQVIRFHQHAIGSKPPLRKEKNKSTVQKLRNKIQLRTRLKKLFQ